MNLKDAPIPESGFYVTHFLTVEDQKRSREFYSEVLGGIIVSPESPCIIKLSNSWIILNNGGGPTEDKPEVTLEPPQDRQKASSFLNLRVSDIQAYYKEWRDKGASFITPPIDNSGWETRCYIRDPDGYIIEVGQHHQKMIDYLKSLG
jgi:predicted enzyme related to lactoylglutathione lyase